MVFKFATVALTEDPLSFDSDSPPPSRSWAVCLPYIPGCSFKKPTTSRQAATGASLRQTIQSSEPGCSCCRPSESLQFPGSDLEVHQGRLKMFAFRELQAATNHFSDEKIVGRGGFGRVYEGLLADGSRVAVKRLAKHSHFEMRELHAEVKVGNMPPHQNLVPVLGFCSSSELKEYMLVYSLMLNGSLSSFLGGPPSMKLSLDWPTRKKIAVGAARGISHLHDHGVIHRDIKPHNILLGENFQVSVGDFGMAIFMDKDEEKGVSKEASFFSLSFLRTQIGGTYGYLDPEYSKSGMCSGKSDVYSFGVTLLELISGRSAQRRISPPGLLLPEWAGMLVKDEEWGRLVDADMPSGYKESEVKRMIQLALVCTHLSPERRPDMTEVVQILEGAVSLEKRWEEY
ncbi:BRASSINOSTEROID INSENSITIVE 1-associated receptor kinase 1-like [Rhodamnia argentea]|uniref:BRASSINOSTEROID INSENSITIVE 1-associated receptor kinase 1-like n=1 Tax=Rhodamnia argentea TaxID=178133 RepID=A0A8B8NCN6_9MYRT|nr:BRASSINOSTEROID INSENSITIVE 1-associated receptor kinase 1-like [Rhodamnia argentea]